MEQLLSTLKNKVWLVFIAHFGSQTRKHGPNDT
jgi:hypothetical protein